MRQPANYTHQDGFFPNTRNHTSLTACYSSCLTAHMPRFCYKNLGGITKQRVSETDGTIPYFLQTDSLQSLTFADCFLLQLPQPIHFSLFSAASCLQLIASSLIPTFAFSATVLPVPSSKPQRIIQQTPFCVQSSTHQLCQQQ